MSGRDDPYTWGIRTTPTGISSTATGEFSVGLGSSVGVGSSFSLELDVQIDDVSDAEPHEVLGVWGLRRMILQMLSRTSF